MLLKLLFQRIQKILLGSRLDFHDFQYIETTFINLSQSQFNFGFKA